MSKTTPGLGEHTEMKIVEGKEHFYKKHQLSLPILVLLLASLARCYWGNAWSLIEPLVSFLSFS